MRSIQSERLPTHETSDDQRRAMQWQHTRCRIGKISIRERNEGVAEITADQDYSWEVWFKLTELMRDDAINSVCMFGTLRDGAVFDMISRGSENIHILTGSCVGMLNRLSVYTED